MLTPGGCLYGVANRHLPSERLTQEAFGAAAVAAGSEGDRVLVGRR
jgi:16S rRNA G1207 methylase RsmC